MERANRSAQWCRSSSVFSGNESNRDIKLEQVRKTESECECERVMAILSFNSLHYNNPSISLTMNAFIIASEASPLVVKMEPPVYIIIYLFIYIVRPTLLAPRVAPRYTQT